MAKKQKATEAPTLAAELQRQYALDRTVLANERTYAAWIRTGLGAMVAGLAIEHLLNEVHPSGSPPARHPQAHALSGVGKA